MVSIDPTSRSATPAVRAVRAHGGDLEVRATAGQGSLATVRLPAAV